MTCWHKSLEIDQLNYHYPHDNWCPTPSSISYICFLRPFFSSSFPWRKPCQLWTMKVYFILIHWNMVFLQSVCKYFVILKINILLFQYFHHSNIYILIMSHLIRFHSIHTPYHKIMINMGGTKNSNFLRRPRKGTIVKFMSF